jgi:MFS family permease
MTVASIACPAAGLDYKWQVMISSTPRCQKSRTCSALRLPKVIMPATGYLSDTFGTKKLFLVTMALFTSGSLLCGLAWNNTSLVAFRVIQGLGGGMMSPVGMTMLLKAVPPRERNAVMGIYGLPLILAPVLGPTVGGYPVE